MHFAVQTSQRQHGGASPSSAISGIADQQSFELTQYSPMGIQHFNAQYKNDPRAMEKLSKRICARVEQDSSDLIVFCDKKIRKRRKKQQLLQQQVQQQQQQQQQQQRKKQHPQHEENNEALTAPQAPEVISASDLLLGACLGQGSFSSVFVLEKHIHRKSSTPAPRRGRRSKLSRQGLDGTNQGSNHNKSTSNRSSIIASSDNNNSTSNHNCNSNGSSTRTRSHTPSLRRRLRQRYGNNKNNNFAIMNDESNRSESNNSQRSRSLSPSRSRSHKNYMPMAAKSSSQLQLLSTNKDENEDIETPTRYRSPTKKSGISSATPRSRSLSGSIRRGIRSVFRGQHNNEEDNECGEESSPIKTTRKSKSHHIRPQHHNDDDDNNNNHSTSGGGRSIFKGGKRSLSISGRRRRSRRSRSRGDENENRHRRGSDDSITADTRFSNDETENDSRRSNHHRGILWRNSTDEANGGENSNLVVKVLQPKLMNQPKLFANCAAGLIREGLFLAAIDHPHVLKVHAWTSPNGWMDFAALSSKEGDLYDGYLLVLERLKGGSLKGWMHKWQHEHIESERAIAAVAAMEEKKKLKKTQQKRLGLPRSLSFTTSSRGEPTSFTSNNSNGNHQHSSSNRLRHTVLKKKDSRSASGYSRNQQRRNQQRRNSEGSVSPAKSHNSESTTTTDSSGYERQFSYTSKWPTAQLSDRASLLLQLSDTVKYLHKHRILHRDLKPDNLGVTFVDPHSNGNGNGKQKQYPSSLCLKVFDFDIARLVPEEAPKEVNELSLLLSKNLKMTKRRKSSGSVTSFDPDMLNNCSNRIGRSVSPFRSASSLTGEEPSLRKRTKKYRGQRPRPGGTTSQADSATIVTTEEASPSREALSRGGSGRGQGETLFEMTAKMGSPRYMAPEIARGELYNLRSEVYTVCLLVHEVLTLQKPYDELAPEDHGRLVHFDLPGYRPPIFSEWQWPDELVETLHKGWGDITQRPSMKDVHSVLKKALPKLCPELVQPKTPSAVVTAPLPTKRSTTTMSANKETFSTKPLTQPSQKEAKTKARSLFHRGTKKSKRASRSSSLTPTASNSDFSLSNDEPLAVDVVQ